MFLKVLEINIKNYFYDIKSQGQKSLDFWLTIYFDTPTITSLFSNGTDINSKIISFSVYLIIIEKSNDETHAS